MGENIYKSFCLGVDGQPWSLIETLCRLGSCEKRSKLLRYRQTNEKVMQLILFL